MARIKHTKNEFKAQRDALKRFERYLPTLQLKKQQLQLEMRRLDVLVREKRQQEETLRADLSGWVALFAEPYPFEAQVRVSELREGVGNIAGVSIPLLDELRFERIVPDLHGTPAWVDDGIRALESLIRLRVERRILEKQHDRLSGELRTTNQRVNLFEKVKIPEAREAIRSIRIFLGDQLTAGVARSKLAKTKTIEKGAAA
jgi:V/A-type H+-transporting ATPase subunit D